jgi:DNA-binding IclR family transcriptional regulator
MSTPTDAWHVSRTLRALEELAVRPRSAPELAEALQVHVRTARRVLKRLEADGYVVLTDDPRRRYRPTMRIVAVAGQVVERCELTQIALPAVRALHERLGEGTHLCVPSYTGSLCLVHADGPCPAKPQLRELVPSHCTATGKALLAWRERWAAAVAKQPLEPRTERTITVRSQLMRELERTRTRGYALEDREHAPDVRAVAAPVFAGPGDAVAAIGVVASCSSLPAEAVKEVAAAVVEAAEALSRELRGDGHAEARAA